MKIVLDMKSIWLQRGDVYEKNNSRQNIRTTMAVYPESSKIDHLKNVIDVSVDKKTK